MQEIEALVRKHAVEVLPGVSMQVCGSYRRYVHVHVTVSCCCAPGLNLAAVRLCDLVATYCWMFSGAMSSGDIDILFAYDSGAAPALARTCKHAAPPQHAAYHVGADAPLPHLSLCDVVQRLLSALKASGLSLTSLWAAAASQAK